MEEKIAEKKIELGLFVYDVGTVVECQGQTAMSILKVLVQDEACNWHIRRKIYEQGWKLEIK